MPDESIEDYKKKVAVLEQKVALYENDPEKSGFYVLRRIVNQQIEYLKGFTIRDKIGGKASEDATYSRTKDMWEGLPKMITELNSLKRELRIVEKAEEDERLFSKQRTTPESIADVLGDNKRHEA